MAVNKKSYIAPIVIGVIMIIYLGGILASIFFIEDMLWLQITLVITFIGLIAATIYVVKERINEIKEGEEDDFSKYWLYWREKVRNTITC